MTILAKDHHLSQWWKNVPLIIHAVSVRDVFTFHRCSRIHIIYPNQNNSTERHPTLAQWSFCSNIVFIAHILSAMKVSSYCLYVSYYMPFKVVVWNILCNNTPLCCRVTCGCVIPWNYAGHWIGAKLYFWKSKIFYGTMWAILLIIAWASCQIRKIASVHAPGMPGTFSPPSQASNPDMHHGTCVTHVPWCMPGSQTSGFLWSQRWGKTSQVWDDILTPTIFWPRVKIS